MQSNSLATQSRPGNGLEIHGVSKRFGPTVALDNVELRVAPGEIVGLMGANGAGKSTLVNILAGVISADSGEVFLDGQPLRA